MKVLSTADAGAVSAFASDTLGAIARRFSTGPLSAAPSQAATASAKIHTTANVGPRFPLMCSSGRGNTVVRGCGRPPTFEFSPGRPPWTWRFTPRAEKNARRRTTSIGSAFHSHRNISHNQIQKRARRHDLHTSVLAGIKKRAIAGDDAGGTPLESRGDVLVVVRAFADGGKLLCPGNQVRQRNEVLEPELRVNATEHLAHLGISRGHEALRPRWQARARVRRRRPAE